MLSVKNNFLWKIAEYTKFQNPIEKFDKEFWEKTEQKIKLEIKEASELLEYRSQKSVKQKQDISFF